MKYQDEGVLMFIVLIPIVIFMFWTIATNLIGPSSPNNITFTVIDMMLAGGLGSWRIRLYFREKSEKSKESMT